MSFFHPQDIIQFSLIVAPLASAVTEAVKRTSDIPKNFLPLVSLGAGVVLSFLYPNQFDVVTRILGGALAGLAAVGGFEAFIKNLPIAKNASESGKK